jgi:hypothetical protein
MNKMEVLQALNTASTARKGARLSVTKTYTVHLDGDVSKLPPQARKLVVIMLSEEQDTWNEVELHELIAAHTEITEKQTPWGVFKWYRATLIEAGWITVSE